MLDVARAVSRIVGPCTFSNEEGLDNYFSEMLEASQPKMGFDKVSTTKLPYCLGSAVFSEFALDNISSRATQQAPKVCSASDNKATRIPSIFILS